MPEDSEQRGGTVFSQRASLAGNTLTRHIARVGAVFDASPIGVAVWSVGGKLLHANPVFTDLVLRSREELVDEPFENFIDPADAPGIRRLVEDVWKGTRNYFECDFQCKRPDGHELWLRTHVTAIYGPTARPEYLISQIFSFVNRGTDESRAQLLASETPAMLWITDDLGIPRIGNTNSFEFLGIPQSSVEVRRALFETVHPDDYEQHRAYIRQCLEERVPLEFTARSMRHDGQWRWLQHRARPLISPSGVFEGWAGASFDVTENERDRRELEEVRRLFEIVTEAGPIAVARADAFGRVVYANGRLSELVADPDAHLTGLAWRTVLLPQYVDEIMRLGVIAIESGEPFSLRVRAHGSSFSAPGGGTDDMYWAELRVAPVFTDAGKPDGFVAILGDISSEVEAGTRADQLARVLDEGTDFLMLVERNGAVSFVNRAAEDVLGIKPSNDTEQDFLMSVLDSDSFEFFHSVVEPILVEKGRWKGELTVHDVEGRSIPVSALVLAHRSDTGRIESISVVARDISDLKEAQWKMHQLASHDFLTGLPNRAMLYERLDHALARHHRLGQTVALLYLDLDEFKPINDKFGHHVGDAVLVELADRIHATVRDTDTPARIGGDEFAVQVEGFDAIELVERIARRLIEIMSEPVEVEKVSVRVGVSIGIVSADVSMTDADQIIARADAAMYEAKAAGRGRYVVVDNNQADDRRP